MRLILLSFALFVAQLSYCQWQATGNDISNTNTGNVGIGTAPAGYKLDVNGWVHTRLGFIADAPAAGSLIGWFRGAANANANVVFQGNAGGAPAFWFTAGAGLKIGGNGGSEPTNGAINITSTGLVGIGAPAPAALLEVQGGQLGANPGNTFEMARIDAFTANNSQLRFSLNRFSSGNGWTTASTRIQAWTDVTPQAYIDFNPNGGGFGMALGTASGEVLRVTSNSTVLIGKTSQTNAGYILDINGNARANQVVVNATGADFVFAPGYRLPRLKELENYIRREHHLPDIAPAAEMQAAGVDLGSNQTRLLQKIEELILYVIEQDKEIKRLKRVEQEMTDIRERLARLEAGK